MNTYLPDYSALFSHANEAVTAALGPVPDGVDTPAALRTADTLAGRIDHTLLKADATLAAIEALCAEAAEHGFASVCVNTRWVPTAAERLTGSPVMVCTVVGFPLGAMTRLAKAEEARITVAEGADEVDMVIDIGGLLSCDYAAVYDDILGVVAAGKPILAEENFSGRIPVPADMVKHTNCFALTVRGDSMKDAGIFHGDVAVIEERPTAENGEIVVAMIDDAVTLKRFYRENNRVKLVAENPAYSPIYTQDVKILGRLKGIIRKY